MTKQHWLIKQEPTDYSWNDLLKDQKTQWEGIRNYQARNNLRAMQPGDLLLFYHSVTEKQIIGIAQTTTKPYPDPTDPTGNWTTIDIKPLKTLHTPITLKTIKNDPQLKNIPLTKNPRLSVMPIPPQHFQHILKLAKTTL